MMQSFHYLVGEPIKYRRAGLAWLRMSQILHERTNGAFDAAYMSAARLLRRKVALPAPARMTGGEVDATVAQLRRDGYAPLPSGLTPEEIASIRRFAFSTPAFGVGFTKPVEITESRIPRAEGRYNWKVRDMITQPAIQRLICEGPFCAIAQEYLDCRPILSGIMLFLDPPYEGHYAPHNYHYDNDGPGFLKFFIYLTDANLGTGAHYFIVGTHSHTKPPRFARAAIYAEEELFSHFSRDQEFVATASAGTIIAEDTAGFHRGSTITRDYRLLMQLQFSALDIPEETELKEKFSPAPVRGLHPGVERIVSKFFVAQP